MHGRSTFTFRRLETSVELSMDDSSKYLALLGTLVFHCYVMRLDFPPVSLLICQSLLGFNLNLDIYLLFGELLALT